MTSGGRALTALIIWFVAFNAAIGVCERLAGVNLFVFPNMGGVEYFRATALMGHPLENAFITSSIMFLVPAMPWTALRKFAVLAICMAGILAFGARSSFATTLIARRSGAVSFFASRALLRGEMRISTMAAAPWIGLLTLGSGIGSTFGTSLGERIVQLAKFDASAQTRLDVFKLFDYLSPSQLLYGVDLPRLNFLIKTYKDVSIIENCWIGLLLMLGAILFVVFALSLLGFFRSIARGRGALAFFAIVNFPAGGKHQQLAQNPNSIASDLRRGADWHPQARKLAHRGCVDAPVPLHQGAWS